MNKVAVLVVTYNRKKLLMENMCAMLKQTYSMFDFYIIDNASTDGTYDTVKKEATDTRIKYYNTGENLGGAGGFSFGLKEILSKDYDYCWIMDDDTIPENYALEELIGCAQALENKFSFLASRVNWLDGSLCKMNAVSIQYSLIKDNLLECRYGLLPIKNCSFVGCFINVSIARKVGLPIKEFFIYGDDSEYTLRLSTQGQGYFCTRSVIVHKIPENFRIGIAEAPLERIDRYNYEYRNRVYIHRKHDKYSVIRIILLYIKECLKVIIRSKNKRGKRIKIIMNGLFNGVKFDPQIECIMLKSEESL